MSSYKELYTGFFLEKNKSFKYYFRFKFIYLIFFTLIFLLAYSFYDKAISDIDYIVKRYQGAVHTSPEYSTNYYYTLFFLTLAFPIWLLQMMLRNRIFSKDMKVNSIGILLQINALKKEQVMLRYTDMSNLTITENKITIKCNEEEIILNSDCFDNQLEFNRFSSIIYDYYKSTEKTV